MKVKRVLRGERKTMRDNNIRRYAIDHPLAIHREVAEAFGFERSMVTRALLESREPITLNKIEKEAQDDKIG